jgi:hypothetical protein
METRREFFKTAAALGALGAVGPAVRGAEAAAAPGDDRAYWVSAAERIARPVLENLARRELKKRMPVEERPGARRAPVTHLEAFGRLLCGLSPWLGLRETDGGEREAQQRLLGWARASLDAATDPASPDRMNFTAGGQPLVDAAFLAQGLLRAPAALWEPLEPRVKRQVVAALAASRQIATPKGNNWVMFAATVEAALLAFGEPALEERLEACVRRMLGWYCGDGAYGDGEFFHFDYYNSFVIQPMLLDVLGALKARDARFAPAYAVALGRARRYAEIQERLIAPDGTFPCLGRSAAYRFGAFQTLAQVAWQRQLPAHVAPAQVRCALTAVVRRMLEAPGTFDGDGWLRIGFCGHQPSIGEGYISTGSLYLCAAGLLPLGLPESDAFWREPAARWTSQKLWTGEDLPADHALGDVRDVEVPTLDRAPQGSSAHT